MVGDNSDYLEGYHRLFPSLSRVRDSKAWLPGGASSKSVGKACSCQLRTFVKKKLASATIDCSNFDIDLQLWPVQRQGKGGWLRGKIAVFRG